MIVITIDYEDNVPNSDTGFKSLVASLRIRDDDIFFNKDAAIVQNVLIRNGVLDNVVFRFTNGPVPPSVFLADFPRALSFNGISFI